MGDSNANSYDLFQAQHILAALIPPSRPGGERRSRPADDPAYLSLSPAGLVGGGRRQQPARQVEPADRGDDAPPPFGSWEECIAWCMTLTRSEAVFAVDSQGFVIACRGRAQSQGYEGAGAELICSIDQLERIAPDAGKLFCVDLEFDKKRLAGFVAAVDEREFYIVGLIAPETLTTQVKQRILSQITGSLPGMD